MSGAVWKSPSTRRTNTKHHLVVFDMLSFLVSNDMGHSALVLLEKVSAKHFIPYPQCRSVMKLHQMQYGLGSNYEGDWHGFDGKRFYQPFGLLFFPVVINRQRKNGWLVQKKITPLDDFSVWKMRIPRLRWWSYCAKLVLSLNEASRSGELLFASAERRTKSMQLSSGVWSASLICVGFSTKLRPYYYQSGLACEPATELQFIVNWT